jgi:hypothetical protein
MKMKLFFIAILSTVVLSSCLKSEDQFGFNSDKGSIVSEIFDRSYYGDLKVIALNATPATETFDVIELRMYAPRSNKPAADISATLVLVPSLVAANGLTALPAAAYSIPSLTVTIPKAGGVFAVKMTLNKTLLDLSKVYGIAFKLTTVSEGVISDLSNEVTCALIIKNAYHANYTVNGWFFHPSSPRAISATKGLTTLGAQRCQGQLGDLGGWYINFDVPVGGGALTGYASAGTTPPAGQAGSSGFMTLDNPGGTDYSTSAPNNTGVAPYTVANYPNDYNAATKTFRLHYGYIAGTSGATQASYTRQMYETWVRQ